MAEGVYHGRGNRAPGTGALWQRHGHRTCLATMRSAEKTIHILQGSFAKSFTIRIKRITFTA
jgi:hypothetical protein